MSSHHPIRSRICTGRAERLGTVATGLKKLADAEEPLYKSLDDAQKQRFLRFWREPSGFIVMWGPLVGISRPSTVIAIRSLAIYLIEVQVSAGRESQAPGP